MQSIMRLCVPAIAPMLVALVASCSPQQRPQTVAPDRPRAVPPNAAHEPLPVADGTALRGHTPSRTFDTRLHASRPDTFGVPKDRQRAVREVLPPHAHPTSMAAPPERPAAAEPHALVLDVDRTAPETLFPGPYQTEWRPPDPTLGVGPNHIVTTVNMAMAIYDKQGALQYALPLNNYGTPGLFEGVGASWFTFDPKCFYDHFAQRFVIVALETYDESNSAWVDIAVSDDADPHGVWHTYRTPVESGATWWDYPGFGFSNTVWVITANRIGGTGVGYRIFDKSTMLGGGAATYFTLNDTGAGTVQVAHCMTPTPGGVPFAVSRSGSTLRVAAITNPTTAPALVTALVATPTYPGGAGAVPTPSETLTLQAVSSWMLNAAWRDGRLVAATHSSTGGRNAGLWYQVDTGLWPASGAPTLTDSGIIDPGVGLHAAYPAIIADGDGDLGVVMNVSGPSQNPGVAVAGRLATDPPGTFGRVRVVHVGESPEGGRWGDYSGIAVDPVDPNLLWGIAQYKDLDGWHNWVTSFRVESPTQPAANDDAAGDVAVQRTIDVLANDYAPTGATLLIDSFDAVSQLGGTVTRLAGGGPGGRDLLTYTPSASAAGPDSFTYTARVQGTDATVIGTVRAQAFGVNTFLPARSTGTLAPGSLRVDYFALTDPQAFPDFASLTPYLSGTTSTINYGSTTGPFAGSGRSENVGAVFSGYIVASTDGLRRFFLSASEGARLFIDGQLIVDCSGPNSSILERSNAVGLRAGPHAFRLEYYERYERAGLTLVWAGGGLTYATGPTCDTIDFNSDGLYPDTQDIADFVAVFGGGDCAPPNPPVCNSDIDFNNDGLLPDTADITAFLRVFAGGDC